MSKTTNSRPKKSPSSKARRKSPERGVHAASTPRETIASKSSPARSCQRRLKRPEGRAPLSAEDRAWLHTELPTQLERDTSLTPESVAESVVWEVECFLNANLPAGFIERLAAKAYYCYDHHRQFHRLLNESGNRGRDALFMFMRHWTAAWLKRERSALYKRLPWSYGQGRQLPVPSAPKK